MSRPQIFVLLVSLYSSVYAQGLFLGGLSPTSFANLPATFVTPHHQSGYGRDPSLCTKNTCSFNHPMLHPHPSIFVPHSMMPSTMHHPLTFAEWFRTMNSHNIQGFGHIVPPYVNAAGEVNNDTTPDITPIKPANQDLIFHPETFSSIPPQNLSNHLSNGTNEEIAELATASLDQLRRRLAEIEAKLKGMESTEEHHERRFTQKPTTVQSNESSLVIEKPVNQPDEASLVTDKPLNQPDEISVFVEKSVNQPDETSPSTLKPLFISTLSPEVKTENPKNIEQVLDKMNMNESEHFLDYIDKILVVQLEQLQKKNSNSSTETNETLKQNTAIDLTKVADSVDDTQNNKHNVEHPIAVDEEPLSLLDATGRHKLDTTHKHLTFVAPTETNTDKTKPVKKVRERARTPEESRSYPDLDKVYYKIREQEEYDKLIREQKVALKTPDVDEQVGSRSSDLEKEIAEEQTKARALASQTVPESGPIPSFPALDASKNLVFDVRHMPHPPTRFETLYTDYKSRLSGHEGLEDLVKVLRNSHIAFYPRSNRRRA